MVIFLFILKIIGIVLLVLACILALILFVPIFYEFDGDIDEGRYRVRISWLLGAVRFRFQFHGKVEAVLQILFYRLDFTDSVKKEERRRRKEKRAAKKHDREERKQKKKREKHQKAREKERESAHQEINLEEEWESAHREINSEEECGSARREINPEENVSDMSGQFSMSDPRRKQETTSSLGTDKGADSENANRADMGETPKKSAGAKQMKENISGIMEKISGAIGLIRFVREHQMLGLIWPKLQILLIRIRPRKLRGQIRFGFSDPAATGQVLGGIAMIPFLYQTELVISPDFESEKAYISGNIYTKGRMHTIHLILFIINMLLDKNIRSFLGSLRKKK